MDDVVLDVAASGQLTSRVEDTFAFDSPHQEAQVVDADMNGDVRSDRATEEIAILDSALRNDDDDAPPICDAPSPLRPITSSQEDISPTETAPTVACTYQPSLLKPGTSLRVVTPYVASEDEELALEMDDVIDLDAAPATDDEYWWYGINRSWGPRNGEKGYFPAHCVRVENWEVALSMPTDVNPVTAATEEEPIELGLAEDADIPETNSSPEDDTRNTAEELLAPDIDDENPEMAIPAPVPPGTKVIVTHPYTRLKADELDLRMGEVVVVMESPDGGWWRGMKNLDGKEPQSGWFPATMVQVEPQERRISIDSTTRSRVALSVPTALPSNNPQAKRQSWYKRLVKKDKIPQGKGSRHRSNSAPSNSNVNLAAWGADRTSIFGSPHRSADILGLEAVLEGCSESELQRSREDNSGGQANSSVEWRQQRSQSAPPATDDMQSTMALDSNVEASAFSLAPSPNDYLVSKFSTGNRQSFIATDDAQAMSIQWQEWVPREILQKMGPKERKRMTAIFELIATERDYVRDLKIIINLFKKPMLDKKVLNNKTADALFSNIEELLSVNQDFLLSLERLYSENPVIEKIGHVLLTSMNQFISYSLYCSQNSTSANKQLNGLHSKREARVFLEEAYKNPATRHLDLGGFLIKPVQRICKYPLLIREILHYTDQRSPDYLLLKSAYDRIQGIVAIANEGARKADMLRRVADIQGNFADKVNIVTSNRHLRVKIGAISITLLIKAPWRSVWFRMCLPS
ncbi:hypothetical protein BC832DRAFT_176526 [Gaertneriomyces semiglobifer]|nr:hypothetical protein BC832DRAFT_176526 [Gaertneriomyces semiglobifer]